MEALAIPAMIAPAPGTVIGTVSRIPPARPGITAAARNRSRPSPRRVAIRSEGGDQADQIDPQAPFAQDHSVQLGGGNAAAPANRTGVSDVDALADLHRNLGRSMTSRLRCPQPRAKPWGRRLRGFLGWSGFRSPLGFRPGIQAEPPDFARPSNCTIHFSNPSMMACWLTMMPMSTSRSAVLRSTSPRIAVI